MERIVRGRWRRVKRPLVMILLILLLTGCGGTSTPDFQKSNMFVYIQKADGYNAYDVVYHKDTKVMYVVSHSSYNIGTFTVLVNPDGTPMLYEAESEDSK